MSVPSSTLGFRRGLFWTGSGSVVNLVLLSLETVIAARVLPTDVFGAFILLLTAVHFAMMAIDFGCKMAVTHLISSGDRARQEAVVGSALAFRGVVVVCASVLIWLFGGLISAFDPSSNLTEYIGYVPLMLATASLDELLSGMLQGFRSYRPMMMAQVARAIFRVGLTATLLIVFDLGIVALVYSWSISFAVAIAYQWWALPARKVWALRWTTLLDILRFGFPLQMTRFLGFASSRLHITLLGLFAGAESVAFFAVANRIPEALRTLADSYFRVYFPSMTTLLATDQKKAADLMFERSLRLVSFGGALAAVTATVFSEEIVTLLFSSKYASSVPVFALLMIALHMIVLVNTLGYTLTAAGRPGRSLWVDVLQMLVNAVGGLLLIPVLGALGAAYSAVLGSYASNPLAAWLIRRSHLGLAVTPYIRQTLILLVCAALGWWIQPTGLAAGLAFKAAVIGLFIILSIRLSTIRPEDISLVVGAGLRRPKRAAESQPIPAPPL